MRITTCEYRGEQHLAIVRDNRVLLPAVHGSWPKDLDGVLEIIRAGVPAYNRLMRLARQSTPESWLGLDRVTLIQPIPRPPRNMLCIGLNYADHAQESAAAIKREIKIPEEPVVFTKTPESITGPYTDIPLDARVTQELDWEVELAVVIGTGGRRIAEQDALKHVFGYSVFNDITARDLQRRHKQFFLGKSLDESSPMGPWITTADEVADPQALELNCWVNGELKQSSSTRLQIFNVARLISILSRGMALIPGDIIATGTPSGVGFARTPPEFLRPGDEVETEVEGLGRLKNRIVPQMLD